MSDLAGSSGLHLTEPSALFLLAALAIALVIRHKRGKPAVVFAPLALVGEDVAKSRLWYLASWPTILRVLAVVLAVLAMARPASVRELPVDVEGIDVLLCLDVSSSMSAVDLDADRDRLEVARDAATEFVALRPQDRIGLVTFARYPDLRCPPTLDHTALTELLGAVTLVEHQGPEDATAIGAAVAECAGILQRSDARSRVVVLLTDGAENVATADAPNEIAPLHAAQLCRDLDVRVYAIAAGGEATSGDWDALDTTEIESLAVKTGGRFFAARDAGSLSRTYAAIDELERSPVAAPRLETRDRFLAFILAAVACYVVARSAEAFRGGSMP